MAKYRLLDGTAIDNIFNKSDKERSGVISIKNLKNGDIQLSSSINKTGNGDSVSIDDLRIPSVHNHPLDSSGCIKPNGECGLQPPSSSDMKVYAESAAVHSVVTKKFTYYIRRTKPLNKKMVEECYKILEKSYDKVHKPHSYYENMWICFTKMTGWFFVIRCRNSYCKHLVESEILKNLFG